MANVKACVDKVLLEEDRTLSGKIVDLKDGAGWTRFGCTSVNHPELIPIGFFPTMPREHALIVAESVYEHSYATPLHISELSNDRIAFPVLSLGINSGTHESAKLLKQAVCSHDIHVAVDGVMGPATVRAANLIALDQLLGTFVQLAKGFYKDLVDANPKTNSKFYRGWTNRANGWLKAA